MNISNSPNKKSSDYTMNGEILETVKHHPYLGVELSDNLKYNTNINNNRQSFADTWVHQTQLEIMPKFSQG